MVAGAGYSFYSHQEELELIEIGFEMLKNYKSWLEQFWFRLAQPAAHVFCFHRNFYLKTASHFSEIALTACLLTLVLPLPIGAQAQTTDMSSIKADLLNDPLFLSHLRDRLSVDTLDDNHILSIVRAYLLEHPEMLIEMQEVLMSKNEEAQAKSAEESARIIAENASLLFDNKDDNVLGNAQGDVQIIEFYDYNCGYCKAAYQDMLELLETDKNLKIVMKDFPILGEDSGRAHLVAQAFKQQAPQHYPEFHHKMMTLEGRATQDSAMEVALSFGIDKQQLSRAMTQEEIQIPLIDNAKVAHLLGFNFTPAYIVGNEIIRGAIDNNQMLAIIKQQRQRQ